MRNPVFSNLLVYFLTPQKCLGEDLGKMGFSRFSKTEKTELFGVNLHVLSCFFANNKGLIGSNINAVGKYVLFIRTEI